MRSNSDFQGEIVLGHVGIEIGKVEIEIGQVGIGIGQGGIEIGQGSEHSLHAGGGVASGPPPDGVLRDYYP